MLSLFCCAMRRRPLFLNGWTLTLCDGTAPVRAGRARSCDAACLHALAPLSPMMASLPLLQALNLLHLLCGVLRRPPPPPPLPSLLPLHLRSGVQPGMQPPPC